MPASERLNKLTKNQNQEWINNMIDILCCAFCLIFLFGRCNSIILVECKNNGFEFQDRFKNRKICNVMITHMCNCIIFDDDGDGSSFCESETS